MPETWKMPDPPGPHVLSVRDPDAQERVDDPYAGGGDSGGIPPKAKVRLPDDVKKLRKRTRTKER
jgi:hypothetical protein